MSGRATGLYGKDGGFGHYAHLRTSWSAKSSSAGSRSGSTGMTRRMRDWYPSRVELHAGLHDEASAQPGAPGQAHRRAVRAVRADAAEHAPECRDRLRDPRWSGWKAFGRALNEEYDAGVRRPRRAPHPIGRARRLATARHALARANSSSTVSRSRTTCALAPSTRISAARGRVLWFRSHGHAVGARRQDRGRSPSTTARLRSRARKSPLSQIGPTTS